MALLSGWVDDERVFGRSSRPIAAQRRLPRLLQIEDPPISSVTKRGSLAHLPTMSDVQKTTIRRVNSTLCIRCGATLPPAAGTGRPRVFCGPGCRKAAYDDRRSRKPEAFRIRIVDRAVVETVETIRNVYEGHDIAECVRRVCGSPRAVTNVVTALSGLIQSRTVLIDGKWAPVVRSIVDLDRAIRNAADREGRRWRR
jgi:ribosomal protein L40E